IGQTLDGQRVLDVAKSAHTLSIIHGLKGIPIWLQGKHDMAGIALYAALFEPKVEQLDLWYPSPSHREGPTLLNVRKYMDVPQAVALALPRSIKLHFKTDAY